jgi:general secretion pathway protein N
MKRWPLIAAGSFFFGAGLLSTAPASLLDAALQRQTQGKLRLAEASGTLWSGHGVVELRDAGGRSGVAKPLNWRVRPAALWRGQLELVGEFTAEPAARPFSVLISPSRIEASEIDLRLPAAALGIGFPKAAVLGLSGQLSVHIARLSVSQKQLLGSATVLWRDAGSGFTPISPLGAYELQLESSGEAFSAALKTRCNSMAMAIGRCQRQRRPARPIFWSRRAFRRNCKGNSVRSCA